MRGVELRNFFPSEMLRGCLVCVIYNSKKFSFLYIIQTLYNDCSHIEDMHLLLCAPSLEELPNACSSLSDGLGL